MSSQEPDRGLASLVEAGRGGGNGVQQAAGRVHRTNVLVHPVEYLERLVHGQVGTNGDFLKIVVGEEGGYLNDHIRCGIESGHLEVKPCQHTVDSKG